TCVGETAEPADAQRGTRADKHRAGIRDGPRSDRDSIAAAGTDHALVVEAGRSGDRRAHIVAERDAGLIRDRTSTDRQVLAVAESNAAGVGEGAETTDRQRGILQRTEYAPLVQQAVGGRERTVDTAVQATECATDPGLLD